METYVGAIYAFGFNYAPYEWMQCQGQVLPLNQYAALFALLGANYGGNGTSNFGLPDLQGRAAVGFEGNNGAVPGNLTPYVMGEKDGAEHFTLTANSMPAHSHQVSYALNTNTNGGTSTNPVNNFPATDTSSGNGNFSNTTNGVMAGGVTPVLANAGSMTAPVNVDCRRPYLAMNYCIAIYGDFPARN